MELAHDHVWCRAGLRENDKVLRINKRTPRDVNDAVSIIKKAGKEMVLTVGRRDQPDVVGQGMLATILNVVFS